MIWANKKIKRKGRLSRKLLLIVILVSTFYTLLTTSYYLYLEYLNIVEELNTNVETIKENYLQTLASSLYKMDEGQLNLELEGALNLAGVVQLHVQEQGGPQYYWEVGKTEQGISYSTYKFPLVYEFQSGDEEIGILTVTTDNSWVYGQLWRKVLIILITNAFKVFFAALTIYFFIQYLVTRHLINIANFVTKLDLTQKTSPLVLEKSKVLSGNDDELDQVAHSINEMVREQIKNQRDLAAEKERLAVTLRSIGDGVITTDTSGKVVLINKVAESLTGWNNDDAVGHSLEKVFHIINEKTRERCENPVKKVLSTGQIIGLANHTALVAKDGREISIADSGAPIRDEQSEIIGVVLVFRDVTEQLKTEKELLKMKKLESVGVLAGGIAHDFNNILAAILGNINLALFDEDLTDKTRGLLTEAEKASLRAKDLTQQLLTFSRGGDPVKETSSLENIIRESANFVLSGDKVACQYNLPTDLWLVDIDKGQISQVIQNLVINASQAMPEGGTISICGENFLSASKNRLLQEGKYVKLSIQDTGIGIPEKLIDKVFDPYFTTKQKGSGLGLAICQSIIRKHYGDIFVESSFGEESIFTIYLPASDKPVTLPQTILEEVKASVSVKILVMDDEEMVRNVAKEMLTFIGHEVVLAQDGDEAVNLYQDTLKSEEPVQLIIMDLTIPGGMGGKDAVQEILKINPEARVVVASGYSNDPIMANFSEYGFCSAIIKPFQLQELERVLSQVLN